VGRGGRGFHVWAYLFIDGYVVLWKGLVSSRDHARVYVWSVVSVDSLRNPRARAVDPRSQLCLLMPKVVASVLVTENVER
jgi:hypothetical protein